MLSFREETSRTSIAPPLLPHTNGREPPVRCGAGCVRQRRIEWEVSSHLCASRQDSAHPTLSTIPSWVGAIHELPLPNKGL